MSHQLQRSLGQRVSQTVSAVLTEYLLDVQPGLYKVIAATDSGNTDRFIHDPMGIAQHEDNSGDWHWMAKDGLGTVRGVYDDTLTEVYAADRDPYGDLIAATGSNPTPFEYTGEPEDPNGLLHLRARYYDPNLAVFNSLDPRETPNRYAYVGANPINDTDPSGQQSQSSVARCVDQCESDYLRELRETRELLPTRPIDNRETCLSDCFYPCRNARFIFENRVDPGVLVNAAQSAGVDPILVGMFIEKEWLARSSGLTNEAIYPVWMIELLSDLFGRSEPSYGISQITVTNTLATVIAHPCFFPNVMPQLMQATQSVPDVERYEATRGRVPGMLRSDSEFAIEVATFFIADLRQLIQHDLEDLGITVGETADCSAGSEVCAITDQQLDGLTRISYRAGWYEPREGGRLPSYYDAYRFDYPSPQERYEAILDTLEDSQNQGELDALSQLEEGVRSCIDAA